MKKIIKSLVKKGEIVKVETIQFSATIEKAGDLFMVTRNNEVEVFGGFKRAYKYLRGGRI